MEATLERPPVVLVDWRCPVCTGLNHPRTLFCLNCACPKPNTEAPIGSTK